MFYKHNKETLLWERDKRGLRLVIVITTSLVLLSFLLGTHYRISYIDNIFEKTLSPIVYDLPKDMNIEYVDSLFKDYEKRAEIYLSQKKFEDSPIKPFMLSTCAKDAYLLTGIYLPVELALAQALLESSMGTKGRSPKNNPYNIGEYDNKTVMRFDNTYMGVRAYYKYMTRDYLQCRPIDLLFKNFTNCKGYRYASEPEYEKRLSTLYFSIKKFIDTNKN
jgi:hypothetical protein